ncbi:MAG: DUF433 domain-containing protein [Verrucomicrobiae bacterium]|nr:DUF433 domain-containing protein [Verrucomicrobiae bacterium]
MAETAVISVRLPVERVARIEREAKRLGRKVSQVAADFIEEGVRRREHPQVEIRETAAGRVAYVKGTRFTVQWVADTWAEGTTAETFAKAYALCNDQVRAALAYATAFAEEIANQREIERDSEAVLQRLEAAWQQAREMSRKKLRP